MVYCRSNLVSRKIKVYLNYLLFSLAHKTRWGIFLEFSEELRAIISRVLRSGGIYSEWKSTHVHRSCSSWQKE